MEKMHPSNLITYYTTLFMGDEAYDLLKYKSWHELKIGDTVRHPMSDDMFCVTRVGEGCVGNHTADLTLIEE